MNLTKTVLEINTRPVAHAIPSRATSELRSENKYDNFHVISNVSQKRAREFSFQQSKATIFIFVGLHYTSRNFKVQRSEKKIK